MTQLALSVLLSMLAPVPDAVCAGKKASESPSGAVRRRADDAFKNLESELGRSGGKKAKEAPPAEEPEAEEPPAAPKVEAAPEAEAKAKAEPEAAAEPPAEPKAKAEPPAEPLEPEPVYVVDFRDGLLPAEWEPFGVVGGDFASFAKVEPGLLRVKVPAGNSWAKTGIMSKEPLVTAGTEPVRVRVEFDEAGTTGFCIALSEVRDFDIWRQQTIWFTWAKTSEAEGSTWFGNTQGAGNHGSLKTGPLAPKHATLTLAGGKAFMALSDGQSQGGGFPFLKPGSKLYFTVYSHPKSSGAPVELAVKALKVLRPEPPVPAKGEASAERAK